MKRTNSKIKTPIVLFKNKDNKNGPNKTEDNINFQPPQKKTTTPGHSSAIQFNPNLYNQYNMNVPNLDFREDNNAENIKVCIRLRPLNVMETGRGDSKCAETNNNQIVFRNKNISRNYGFNNVFGESTTQEEIFFNSNMNVYSLLNLEGYR
jgi:hypothetical protein